MSANVDGTAALRAVMAQARVVVCVGSGGVGKTTTAAALAIHAASAGRRALVITIDPALRLANALGLSALSHTPTRIDPKPFEQAGLKFLAPLSAMMLDVKAAWDDMLVRTAPSRAIADKILSNRFYAQLSSDLPGAHEFIACEQLHRLAQSGEFDIIVLDTPPTQNALDFLEAPSRILAVLDNEAFRFFAARRQSIGSFFDGALLAGAAGRAQSVLARFAGEEVLEELGDFIVLLRDLYGPLTNVTKELVALLRGNSTQFAVVTAPSETSIREAVAFTEQLNQRALHCAVVVANKVTAMPNTKALGTDALQRLCVTANVNPDAAHEVLAALSQAALNEEAFAAQDAAALARLAQAVRAPVVVVPRMSHAVHDAARLASLLTHLVGGSQREPQTR